MGKHKGEKHINQQPLPPLNSIHFADIWSQTKVVDILDLMMAVDEK